MSSISSLRSGLVFHLILAITTTLSLQFIENDFELKVPEIEIQTHNQNQVLTDSVSRNPRIFSTFFSEEISSNSDEVDDEVPMSADPALYWAKLKRNSLRKKGSLKGSFTTNKGIVSFYMIKISFCHQNFTLLLKRYFLGSTKSNLNYAFLKPEKYEVKESENCKPASPIRIVEIELKIMSKSKMFLN